MRPPRPAPIVAAAVLLIVVGSLLILGYFGVIGYLVYELEVLKDGGPCCASILFVVCPVVGLDCLGVGTATLRGTLEDPKRTGNRVVILGWIAVVLSAMSMICCGWSFVVLYPPGVMNDSLQLLAGLFCFWMSTAGILTAGKLLQRNAERYLDWQKRRHPPSDTEGYDPEADA